MTPGPPRWSSLRGRRRRCAAAQLRVAGILAAVFLSSPDASRAVDAREYWPLEKGGAWHYSIHRDVVVEIPGGPSERSFLRGREDEQVQRVVQVDGAVEVSVQRVTSVRDAGSGPEQVIRLEQGYRADDRGVGLARVVPAGEPAVEYDPPLRLLGERLEPGSTWDVGRMRRGALEVLLRAEVKGFEDVTEGGRTWKDCLQVDYRGHSEGVSLESEMALEVVGGSFERTVWYQPGVGMVRDVTRDRIELRQRAGARQLVRKQVTTRVLVGQDAGAPPDSEGAP